MNNKDNNRTSPVLFLICFLACIATGAFVTQPKAGPSPMKAASHSDIIPEESLIAQQDPLGTDVSGEESVETEATPSEAVVSEEAAEATSEEAAAVESLTEETSVSDQTESITEISVEETAVSEGGYSASPEAGTGYWSKGIGEWYYVVDGHNYHGWLYDTDQRVYYLNPENGVMATGWTEIEGKTYYFSPDGVLQTGNVNIEGQLYQLGEDGVLAQETQAVPEETPTAIITAVPTRAPEPVLTPTTAP